MLLAIVLGCRTAVQSPVPVAPPAEYPRGEAAAVYRTVFDTLFVRADFVRRRDSTRREEIDSVARERAPRRVRVRAINGSTGNPMRGATVVLMTAAHSPWGRGVTDWKGEFVFVNPPLGGAGVGVNCPKQNARPDSGLWLGATYVYPAIDTVIELIPPSLGRCWQTRAGHVFHSGWLESAEARMAPDPTTDAAAVYLRVLQTVVPKFLTTPRSVAIASLTRKLCVHDGDCGQRELALLQALGVLDPLTASDFVLRNTRSVPLRPAFAIGRGLPAISTDEIVFLRRDGAEWGTEDHTGGIDSGNFWRAFNARYPAATGLVSFSQVGFNADRTQALVEFRIDRQGEPADGAPEMMLLNKSGEDWRISKRHIARGATSARVDGSRCIPASPGPALAAGELIGLRGEFEITMVATVGQLGSTQKRVRLGHPSAVTYNASGDTLRRGPGPLLPILEVLDSLSGQPRQRRFPEVHIGGAGLALPTALRGITFDGYHQYLTIRDVRGRDFFGSWESGVFSHDTFGYFCARFVRGN